MSNFVACSPISAFELHGPAEANEEADDAKVFTACLFSDGSISVLDAASFDALVPRIALAGQNPLWCDSVRRGIVPDGFPGVACELVGDDTVLHQRLLAICTSSRAISDFEVQVSPALLYGSRIKVVRSHAPQSLQPSRCAFVAAMSEVFFHPDNIGVTNLPECSNAAPRRRAQCDILLKRKHASYQAVAALLELNRRLVRDVAARSSMAR